MIELPEARVCAEQLTERLVGRQVTEVIAAHTPHKFAFFLGEPEGYGSLLAGEAVDEVQANGGHIELCLGDKRLYFGDGAAPRLWGPGDKLPAKHQLLMSFDDGSMLTATVRMYGCIMAFREGELDNFYYLVAKERVSPLEDGFDEAYFRALTEFEGYEKASAKAFLATEQRIPGLGNGVVQDILFRAGIHPKRKMGTVSDGQLADLYSAVKTVLWEMTLAGGRDAERDVYGCPGGYHPVLGKDTVGKPCPVCGSELQKGNFLGGSIYFCPGCQPL